MGEHDVKSVGDPESLQPFQRALLDDLEALARMLDGAATFDDTRRIGAEQEMFLVDGALDPADRALDVLRAADDPRLTTEIALYNLEANLTPHLFRGDALRALERELRDVVDKVRRAARSLGADVVLAGSLPTLSRAHLDKRHMTPSPRYAALDERLRLLRGESFRVHVRGVDELELEHPDVMIEAFNTSFQLHLQVSPAEFARVYNVAQLVTGPVLAAAANSPMLLGHRLWRETRIAIFQQSIDARPRAQRTREAPPRVTFGSGWVSDSILELFRDNILRYHALLGDGRQAPRATEALARGEIPDLPALRLHNGTIYRWNRPCFGVVDGVPHLRVEARAFPAGPSIVDEVANAALFFGLLVAGPRAFDRVEARMPFSRAQEGFLSAARYGLAAQVPWLDGKTYPTGELLTKELIPLARRGLEEAAVDGADIDRYLGIVEARVAAGVTGADWTLRAASPRGERVTDASLRRATRAMLEAQQTDAPVHAWPRPEASEGGPDSYRTVGQFMTTDLVTVRVDDALEVATALMRWRAVRHVPVEDTSGAFAGLVSPTSILRAVEANGAQPASVRDATEAAQVALDPDTPTRDALHLLLEHRLSAMPVLEEGRLVGLVTERDLLRAAEALLAG